MRLRLVQQRRFVLPASMSVGFEAEDSTVHLIRQACLYGLKSDI